MSQATTNNTAAAPAKQASPWREHVRDFFGSRLAVFGLVVAALLILAAILAPWLLMISGCATVRRVIGPPPPASAVTLSAGPTVTQSGVQTERMR